MTTAKERPRQLTVRVTDAPTRYDGPPRSVRIVIYPTLEQMRDSAAAWCCDDCKFPNAYGITSPTGLRKEWNRRKETWEWENDGNPIATVRLAKGHVNADLLVHELTHAALVIYRRDIKLDVRLGTGHAGMEREEYLAYMIGELAGKASTALHKKGLWS